MEGKGLLWLDAASWGRVISMAHWLMWLSLDIVREPVFVIKPDDCLILCPTRHYNNHQTWKLPMIWDKYTRKI